MSPFAVKQDDSMFQNEVMHSEKQKKSGKFKKKKSLRLANKSYLESSQPPNR